MSTPTDTTATRQAELQAYRDEHGTWPAARERFAEPTADLENLYRDALAALDVLEPELGPTWPRDALGDHDGLGAFLGNAAPWTARQWVRVAEDIALVKGDAAWWSVVREGSRSNA